MPGCVTVDGAAPPALVLSHMRGHTQGPRPPDEVARVIGAVRAERGRPADAALQQLKRRLTLGPAIGLGQLHVDD